MSREWLENILAKMHKNPAETIQMIEDNFKVTIPLKKDGPLPMIVDDNESVYYLVYKTEEGELRMDQKTKETL